MATELALTHAAERLLTDLVAAGLLTLQTPADRARAFALIRTVLAHVRDSERAKAMTS